MSVLPTKSLYSFIEFYKQNKPLVYKFILMKMQEAIDTNAPSVEFFRFADNSVVSRVDRKDYKSVLDTTMQVLIKQELYEDAAMCRDLLNKLT